MFKYTIIILIILSCSQVSNQSPMIRIYDLGFHYDVKRQSLVQYYKFQSSVDSISVLEVSNNLCYSYAKFFDGSKASNQFLEPHHLCNYKQLQKDSIYFFAIRFSTPPGDSMKVNLLLMDGKNPRDTLLTLYW